MIAHENRLDHIEEKTAILKEMGVPYFFVVTVTKKNKEELKDILAYATKANIPVLRSPMVLEEEVTITKNFYLIKMI